jgi:hypothetical protein
VHFGLEAADQIASAAVEWPRGGRETWTGLDANAVVTVRQGSGRLER